jgi:hypothetical protein
MRDELKLKVGAVSIKRGTEQRTAHRDDWVESNACLCGAHQFKFG